MSKIKFTLLDIESYDHVNCTTLYDLAFTIKEQDLGHAVKLGNFRSSNGLQIRTGAYPYIPNYVSDNAIYIKSSKDHECNNKTTSVRFTSFEKRLEARKKIIEALKEWSEK